MANQLDRLNKDIVDGGRPSPVVVGVARTAVVMSVGYVLYAFRAGSLLAGLLASMPIWRSLDPLPLLEAGRARKAKKKQRDDDPDAPGEDRSLDSLID
jgi:hypothetical protein